MPTATKSGGTCCGCDTSRRWKNEELRQALLEFRDVYNATWLIERHGFVSLAAFRQRHLQPVAKAA